MRISDWSSDVCSSDLGVQKFFSFPVAFPMPLNPMLHAAGVIELVSGGLIAIGLFTRPAAFIASGMAAVGYWMMHGSKGLYPIVNGGETIALYCFFFLFIPTLGPGSWSVDGATQLGLPTHIPQLTKRNVHE